MNPNSEKKTVDDKPSNGAITPSQIKADMKVVCSKDGQFGVVDHMQGATNIKLKKDDQGVHHYMPLSWVTKVDDKLHIDRPGEQAMREWSTEAPKNWAFAEARWGGCLPAPAFFGVPSEHGGPSGVGYAARVERRWNAPPWESPLDVATRLRAIPEHATITGVFLSGVRDLAKHRGIALSRARASYVAFKPYPLHEHAELMVACAVAVWPLLPLREALRKMGRGAAGVLIASHLGRVVFGSVEGPIELIRAMARSYQLHVKPGSVEAEPDGPRRIVVRMREIHYFLDSHHVGVFEGVLKHAALDGEVRIASLSEADADLLVTWQ